MTDSVMQVIARRVRNAKKKLQKVSTIEGLMQDGETLNEDQERVYRTKEPLTAIIEELLKLEPLVEAALANEFEERLNAAKEIWRESVEEATQQISAVAQVTSEGGESEATVEGPSRAKMEEEETKEETASAEAVGMQSDVDASLDNAIEVLYFVELFMKGRFDLMPFVGDETEEKVGIISAEEIEILENFGKKIFQTTAHVPKEALESAKEAGKCLLSASSDEATKVFEVVRKLKASDVMENELKLTVHGFPVAIDKEVSETATDKSEERLAQEHQPTDSAATQEPPCQTDENPPPSSPVYHSPHFIQPTEAIPVAPRSPRPFLPFPGVAMSGPPSLGFAMTQTPSIIGMHSFYSMAPVPGHFIAPQFPGVHPPIIPTPQHPFPDHTTPPETSIPEDTPEKENEPIDEPEATTRENIQDEEELKEPESSPPPEALPQSQDVEAEADDPSSRPPDNPPQHRSSPSGGRFDGNTDYRPYSHGRGRYPYAPNRGTPRGRTASRGRHPYSHTASRRPPFDPSASHGSYLPTGHERHPNPYGRRRGGYKDSSHY